MLSRKGSHLYRFTGKTVTSRSVAAPISALLLFCFHSLAQPQDVSPQPKALATSPIWIAESGLANAQLGFSVASAGDVNSDGYLDIIAGAPYYQRGERREGAAFLYQGSANGPSLLPAWQAESDTPNIEFGTSVASVGDVNGDGFDDVIVGAPRFSNGETNEGAAFVYYGSPLGLPAEHDWQAEGGQTFAFFGYAVAGAGDVNGDGYADALAGAFLYDGAYHDAGRAFLYLGSSAGLSHAPAWTADGVAAGSHFGAVAACAGDVNGDGYADVIIGAPRYNGGQVDEGAAYVFLGGPTGLSRNPAWQAESNQADARFGFSVTCAGDVNGDGFDDIAVGAYRFSNGQNKEGRVYVYHGGPQGPSTTPSWIAEGGQDWAYFGYSVAGVGDLNDDGFDELAVGSYWFDNGEFNEGRVEIFWGGGSGLMAVPGWTAEGNQENAAFGAAVAAAGDVNGDGYGDLLVGAPLYGNGEENEGRIFLFPGSGVGLLDGPPPPIITTDGGRGPGADFFATQAQLLLEGTASEGSVSILVNGSPGGVVFDTSALTWRIEVLLLEGPNVFLVTALNAAGIPSIPDTITITLDTTLPDAPVILTNGGNGPGADFATNQPNLILEGRCVRDAAEIRVNDSVEGVAYLPGATTWSYTALLSEGSNFFSVTAVDGGGNVSPPDTIRITLDTVPPAAPVITTDGGNGPGQPFRINTREIVLEGAAPLDAVWIRVNGSIAGVSYVPGAAAWSYAGFLEPGANLVRVEAVDLAGNVSEPATIFITVDLNILPAPIITTDGGNGPGQSFTTREPILTLAGACHPAAAAIEVNGGAQGVTYTPGQNAWSFTTTLAEGANAFEIRAINIDGYPSLPARITVTLDTTPPEKLDTVIVITSSPDVMEVGQALRIEGLFATDPPDPSKILAGRPVTVRYTHQSGAIIEHTAFVNEEGRFEDTFAVTLRARWTAQARFFGDSELKDSGWSNEVSAAARQTDLNEDGVVNAVDVQLAILGALDRPLTIDPDVDGNGVTNAVDVQLAILAALR